MKHVHLQRAFKRAAMPAAFLAALLTCALILGGLWSCARKKPLAVRQRPLTYTGVPMIRVLITPVAVEQITVATAGGYRLTVDGAVVAESDGPLSEGVVTRSGRAWYFGLFDAQGRQVILQPNANSYARLGATKYRGNLRFLPVGQKQFRIVNQLDLESYLAGVLAKELYPFWLPETYRAQAVAARTFAMHAMLTFGESHEYDLGSTQSWQVYGGFSAETPKAWDAVRASHGQVLTHGDDGDERVFMAQYSACCGGRVNAAKVIRDAKDIEPLRGGQVCTGCAGCPRYRWKPVRIAKADLHRALVKAYKSAAKLTGVAALRVAETNPHGRIVWVEVVGPNKKSIRLRAEDIRLVLLRASVPGAGRLYSMNCRFRDLGKAIEFYDGRGFGHGVGLCQWGAQAKAIQGAPAEEILGFYYAGAKIFRAY